MSIMPRIWGGSSCHQVSAMGLPGAGIQMPEAAKVGTSTRARENGTKRSDCSEPTREAGRSAGDQALRSRVRTGLRVIGGLKSHELRCRTGESRVYALGGKRTLLQSCETPN